MIRLPSWRLVALFIISCLASPLASAQAPLGVGAAVREVYVAIDTVEATANGLPAETQQALGADVPILVASVEATLSRLGRQPVPIVDHAVTHDLHFVADIAQSVTDELEMLGAAVTTQIDQAASSRIDRLGTVVATRLDRIDGAVDQWVEKNRGMRVRFEDKGDVVVVRGIAQGKFVESFSLSMCLMCCRLGFLGGWRHGAVSCVLW